MKQTASTIGGTAVVALIASLITWFVERRMAEALFNGNDAVVAYGQLAFLLAVPLGFGAVALLLPGARRLWQPSLVVAACSAAGLAHVVATEVDSGQDVSREDILAGQRATGVTFFSGGMLLPLAGTIVRLARGRGGVGSR